jgi:hypothetical protein
MLSREFGDRTFPAAAAKRCPLFRVWKVSSHVQRRSDHDSISISISPHHLRATPPSILPSLCSVAFVSAVNRSRCSPFHHHCLADCDTMSSASINAVCMHILGYSCATVWPLTDAIADSWARFAERKMSRKASSSV